MDNKTAQEILSAYRPGGEDAHDKVFQEALEQCGRDPAMGVWLQRERDFDQAVVAALDSIEVPRSGKADLLHMAMRVDGDDGVDGPSGESPATRRERPIRRLWRAGIGLAALFVLGLLLWPMIMPSSTPRFDQPGFSMGELISRGIVLSYRDNDPDAVRAWLTGRSAPVPQGFPAGLVGAEALGCRIYELPEGGKISLICLLKKGEVVHYFVFDEQAKALLAYAPLDTWWSEQGWSFYSFKEGNHRIALATQGQSTHLL